MLMRRTGTCISERPGADDAAGHLTKPPRDTTVADLQDVYIQARRRRTPAENNPMATADRDRTSDVPVREPSIGPPASRACDRSQSQSRETELPRARRYPQGGSSAYQLAVTSVDAKGRLASR